LANGHPVECLPNGGRGSRANLVGGAVLETDPKVESAGVDTGFASTPNTLRAPDVAVGNVPDRPGWVTGPVPPLAVEYADTGQDEAELAARIQDLLAAGTQLIWVVRLVGPRRVEIHRPGAAPTLAYPGQDLHAPAVLANPVPVLALFERDAAHAATLRNLLQRKGYRDLDQVRAEGKAEGERDALRNAILLILGARGLAPSPGERQRLADCAEAGTLKQWLGRAATAEDTAGVFGTDPPPKAP
jgi:hypothetical protein